MTDMEKTEATDAESVDTESVIETPPSFRSLGICDEVMEAIDGMGWEFPTPVQSECYAKVVAGSDLIVQSRTGTGKTAAFGIPLVDRVVTEEAKVQALILAPTRELALQSSREIGQLAGKRKIGTTAVYGGAPMEKQIRELESGTQIISGTPGRVLDHLRRNTFDYSNLKILVLDEADEMLSMGFAKELNAILERLPPDRQTLLFSATVEGAVRRIAERHMNDPVFVTLSGDHVGALGIDHCAYMINGIGRTRDLVKVLNIENPESAIIFCNTKSETEEVAQSLKNSGFDAEWINGDLPQRAREKVLARCRAGALRYLVATDVAARGIDISHVTHVINFTLPTQIEQYVHRTGRTGRAGRTGTAISLVGPAELGALYYLRLQYQIQPVERSLPSESEEQTRLETDRIDLLQSDISSLPSELNLALARRLITHENAEAIIAGLLDDRFSDAKSDIDEVAAQA